MITTVLGREYSEINSAELIKSWNNLFWITYRHDFSPIPHTVFTGDAGWGCMIRCGQMLTASAIASVLFGNRWLHEASLDKVIRTHIISYFIDSPEAPLSIHRIVEKGIRRDRRPGEWHAPSITAHCLTELINERLVLGLRAYCARDMTIDRSQLVELLDGSKVLIWLPMRLGVDRVNERYSGLIEGMLKSRWCVGLAGGRPNSAFYFVGFDSNLDNLLYLDPHYSRPAINVGEGMTEEQIASYSCSSISRLPIAVMDPCLVAGFVVSDLMELDEWLTELVTISGEGEDGMGDLISIIEGSSSNTVNDINCQEEDDIIDIDFVE